MSCLIWLSPNWLTHHILLTYSLLLRTQLGNTGMTPSLPLFFLSSIFLPNCSTLEWCPLILSRKMRDCYALESLQINTGKIHYNKTQNNRHTLILNVSTINSSHYSWNVKNWNVYNFKNTLILQQASMKTVLVQRDDVTVCGVSKVLMKRA